MSLTYKILALVGCVVFGACSSSETSEPSAPTDTAALKAAPTPSPTAPPPVAPTAAPGPLVEDPTFTLAATAAGPYALNQLGHFAITLTPKGEYHVNEEYPLAITITAPGGVAVAKTELEKSDAAEVTAKTARFDVPITPKQAGEHRVTAKVSFAVCTPENCVPDERTLELALLVP